MLEQFATDPWGRLALQHLATGGMHGCIAFLLVSTRLMGAIVVAPYFLASSIPVSIRFGLTLLLSLVIAPSLPELQNIGSESVANRTLTGAIDEHGDSQIVQIQSDDADTIAWGSDRIRTPTAETSRDVSIGKLVGQLASEFGIGSFLGFGVMIVFGGLRLGGEWLERQSGLGMGSILNPQWSAGDSPCGTFVQLLGVVAFLVMEPIGGQSVLLRWIFDSFHVLPAGSAVDLIVSTETLSRLIQQSMLLGVRVALPLVVTMTFIDTTLAFAGRNSPQLLSSASFAIRAVASLFVLSMTLTTIPEVVTSSVLSALQEFGARD